MFGTAKNRVHVPSNLPKNKFEPHVVIVGAGFGGLAAARELANSRAIVTLIDRTNHHLFQPLLNQVALAALAPSDVAVSNRQLFEESGNVDIIMANVERVEPYRKLLRLVDGRTLTYDYLILATGSRPAVGRNDEISRHVFFIKTLADSLKLRTHITANLEKAKSAYTSTEIQKLLSFAVVGGGPAGVELAGSLTELKRSVVKQRYAAIDPKLIRIMLCHAGPRLLPTFSAENSTYAEKQLRRLGVDVRLNTKVQDVNKIGFSIGAERIECQTMIWCAGITASIPADGSKLKADVCGRLLTAPDCSLPDHRNIFAIGDVSRCESKDGIAYPPLASVAKQQGKFVARKIIADLKGSVRKNRQFRYQDLGRSAVIGRSRAVMEFGKFQIRGRMAWLGWSLVHMLLLADLRSRLTACINWAWSWLTSRRSSDLIGSPLSSVIMVGAADQQAAIEKLSDRGDQRSKTAKRGRPKDMAKRKAILAAARTELDLRGAGALSVEKVARRAGVSKVTIYSAFGNAHDLYAAIHSEQ